METDFYSLVKQRLAEHFSVEALQNSREHLVEIEKEKKRQKHLKYWANRSEEVKQRKKEREKLRNQTLRKTPEYRQHHAEYMREWRRKKRESYG